MRKPGSPESDAPECRKAALRKAGFRHAYNYIEYFRDYLREYLQGYAEERGEREGTGTGEGREPEQACGFGGLEGWKAEGSGTTALPRHRVGAGTDPYHRVWRGVRM